jgi:hypothetical protein
MSDLQDVIATNAIRAYNEGFARGITQERDRIVSLLQEAISECGEQCDYCVAQEDAIEMLRESE